MDPSSMPETQALSASVQFVALAAALGGVLLGAVLLAAGLKWIARRHTPAQAGATTAGEEPGVGDGAGGSDDDGARPDCGAVSYLLMAAALVLAVLLLPGAVVVRQLWPHPDLGWPMVACWAGILLPVVAAWLVLARAAVCGTPSRRRRT